MPLLGSALGFLGNAVSEIVGCALMAIAFSLGLPSVMLVVSSLTPLSCRCKSSLAVLVSAI